MPLAKKTIRAMRKIRREVVGLKAWLISMILLMCGGRFDVKL